MNIVLKKTKNKNKTSMKILEKSLKILKFTSIEN